MIQAEYTVDSKKFAIVDSIISMKKSTKRAKTMWKFDAV